MYHYYYYYSLWCKWPIFLQLVLVRLAVKSVLVMFAQCCNFIHGAHHTSSAAATLATSPGPATDSVQVGSSSPQVSHGILQPIWLMIAAGPATASPILDHHRIRWYRKSHWPERHSATDPLPSTDHVFQTVYRHQFATQHYQLSSFLIVFRTHLFIH